MAGGTIWGSFSGTSTSNVRPYITWSGTADIPNNKSSVSATLVFVKYNSSWGSYNSSFSNTNNINGSTSTTNNSFDIRPVGTAPVYSTVRTRTIDVAHNADGTKTCTIGWSGNTGTSLGTFNFSSTVTLDTIPRRATITSGLSHTIGNNLAYTLTNDGALYVKLVLYCWNGSSYTQVISSNRGTGTSGTITLGTTENNTMYNCMPNNTSRTGILRAYTYSDSGYSVQVGDYHDVVGTIYVNQTTNKPTFTTYTVGNLDKTIDNTDKYSNVLVSSSTSTLLGSDSKMIKGYSKLRAVITSANKMVALNYATEVKYRFTVGSAYKEENYHASNTVNLDVDNATTSSVSVTAYDSRSLTTTVADSTSITNNANYSPVSAWGITLTRDNGVDTGTKLAFSGSYWNEYFGGGTSGVQNTITAHWRYKLTTESWSTQTWTAITPTDTNGSLSYDAYIEGDLGASGFDADKSFNIEVRLYDKLTNTIIEGTLDVGTPVLDITKDGIAIKNKYDDTEGGDLQVYGGDIARGWFSANNETWTYTNSSTYSNTNTTYAGTITISGDKTDKYSVGMRVKYTQTTVKYGIITDVSYSSPSTTMTIYGGTDYQLANATIESPYFSTQKAPAGFPLLSDKWEVFYGIVSSGSSNYKDGSTLGQMGSLQISIPMGNWNMDYKLSVHIMTTSGSYYYNDMYGYIGLSTSTASWSSLFMKNYLQFKTNVTAVNGSTRPTYNGNIVGNENITLTTDTTYYLIGQAFGDTATNVRMFANLGGSGWIKATCLYL